MKPDYTNVCLIVEQAYPLFVALNGPGTPSLGTHKWVFTARIRAWLHLDETGCLCRYGVITPNTMERLLREADSVCMAGGSTLLSVYNHYLVHAERGLAYFAKPGLVKTPDIFRREAVQLQELASLLLSYVAARRDIVRRKYIRGEIDVWYERHATEFGATQAPRSSDETQPPDKKGGITWAL